MPVWGPERPLTLLWVAVDDGAGGRALLGANEAARVRRAGDAAETELLTTVRAEIVAAADERGLPIAWPLLDLEDLNAVDVHGRLGRVRRSDRRGVGALSCRRRADRPSAAGNLRQRGRVVVRARRRAPGAAGRRRSRRSRRRGRSLCCRLGTVGGASVALSDGANVLTAADYGRVVSYLERQSVLESVDVESFGNGTLSLRVAARGDARVLERVLALGGVLRPAAAIGSFGSLAFEVVGVGSCAMSWRFMPNAICVARMLLVAPLVLWIVEGRYAAALLVLVVAGISDGLDGFLAKRFDWRTRLGGLLDPAADKLLLVGAFAALTLRRARFPSSSRLVVVARDVVIVLGAILLSVAHRARARRARGHQQAEHGVSAREWCSSR